MNSSFPILEFDPAREALIEPSRVIRPHDVPSACVICFFQEVIDKVVPERHARVVVSPEWEDGPHPIYEIAVFGQRLALYHPGVGAPVATGRLEEAIAYGCRKFIACGGCGVLENDLHVGSLVVVSAALRDEGTSYHFLPPTREIEAQPAGVLALQAALERRGLPYLLGKAWTTDAPYRETLASVAARKAEGCSVVEMEAAAMMAVAQFRGVLLGQVLYGGDDLSGAEWDSRGWQSRTQVRESLFWLAVEACLELPD